MKNQFTIHITYSPYATSIEISLSPRFKVLVTETFAICLAFTHGEGAGKAPSEGLALLQKLAFDHLAKSRHSPKEVREAFELACLAGLHFAAQGRPNDNLARVIVMLAQATSCRIPQIKLPALKKLKLVYPPSKLALAAYKLLRRNASCHGAEIPVYAAYQIAHALSYSKAPTDSVRKLMCHLGRETHLFVTTLTKLGELSRSYENSLALEAAMRN